MLLTTAWPERASAQPTPNDPWAQAAGEALSPIGPVDDAAPSAESASDPGPWVPSLRSMGAHAWAIAEAPFSLSTHQQMQVLGAGGVLFGVMSALDGPAYRSMTLRPESATARATGPLAAPGRWYDRASPDRVAMGTAGAFALSGLVLQDRKMTRTSVRVVEAVLYTKLVVGLGKGLASRSRPFVNAGPFESDPGAFANRHEHASMPSGHTARAFAIASVVAHQYPQWYVQLPAYGMASSVALERVRSGDHWVSDVLVGGALGYLIGRSVTSHIPSPDGFAYAPILSTESVGVSIRF